MTLHHGPPENTQHLHRVAENHSNFSTMQPATYSASNHLLRDYHFVYKNSPEAIGHFLISAKSPLHLWDQVQLKNPWLSRDNHTPRNTRNRHFSINAITKREYSRGFGSTVQFAHWFMKLDLLDNRGLFSSLLDFSIQSSNINLIMCMRIRQ